MSDRTLMLLAAALMVVAMSIGPRPLALIPISIALVLVICALHQIVRIEIGWFKFGSYGKES